MVPKLDGCYPNKNEISQALGKSNGCSIVLLAVLKVLIKVISLSHYLHCGVKLIFMYTDKKYQPTEDEAVGITCAAMGWKEPKDWRLLRERKRDTHKIPFLDLADWDKKQQQQRKNDSVRKQKEGHSNDGNGSNSTPRKDNNNEHNHGTRQDEKKDEDQYQC